MGGEEWKYNDQYKLDIFKYRKFIREAQDITEK